jgi:hypothetical protein
MLLLIWNFFCLLAGRVVFICYDGVCCAPYPSRIAYFLETCLIHDLLD